MAKYLFKEGEQVYHKENLSLLMTVSRILKESKMFTKGYDAKGNAIKEEGIRLIGIEVHWWQADPITKIKDLKTHKFHSTELVPKEIGEKGEEATKEWLRSK